jgi:hypothetical protein
MQIISGQHRGELLAGYLLASSCSIPSCALPPVKTTSLPVRWTQLALLLSLPFDNCVRNRGLVRCWKQWNTANVVHVARKKVNHK